MFKRTVSEIAEEIAALEKLLPFVRPGRVGTDNRFLVQAQIAALDCGMTERDIERNWPEEYDEDNDQRAAAERARRWRCGLPSEFGLNYDLTAPMSEEWRGLLVSRATRSMTSRV